MAALPAMPQSFAEVVALAVEKREGILATHLRREVRLVRFEVGRIECRVSEDRHLADLPQRLTRALTEWTGAVDSDHQYSRVPAEPTLIDQDSEAERNRRDDAANHPLIQSILAAFPGSSESAPSAN